LELLVALFALKATIRAIAPRTRPSEAIETQD
jgi:hypothetical protein